METLDASAGTAFQECLTAIGVAVNDADHLREHFCHLAALRAVPSEAQAPFFRVALTFFNLQNYLEANGLIRAGTRPSAISRLETLARWAEEDVRVPFPTNAEQRSLIRAGIEAVRRVGVRDEAERRSEDAASLESLIARRQAMENSFRFGG